MCGLFGWKLSKKISLQDRAILGTILALENDERGGDSWGYLDVHTDTIAKGLGKLGWSGRIADMIGSTYIMGHTRKATTGKVTVENAHPFRFDGIVGAHNGVITNHATLNQKYERDFAVDSMHIFANIKENKPLKKIQGWGAITYHRPSEGGLFLGRFDGTLHVAVLGEKNDLGLVWSSEASAVEKACEAIGRTPVLYQIRNRSVYRIDDHDKEFRLYVIKGMKLDVSESPLSRHVWMGSGNTTTTGYGVRDFRRFENFSHSELWDRREDDDTPVSSGLDDDEDGEHLDDEDWGQCDYCGKQDWLMQAEGWGADVMVCWRCQENLTAEVAAQDTMSKLDKDTATSNT